MKEERKLDLLDLYNKIQAENNVMKETMLRIQYVPNNLEDTRLIVDAELKPTTINDAASFATYGDETVGFDLRFKEYFNTLDYDSFLYEFHKNKSNRFEDESLEKYYLVLMALINPVFLLYLIDEDKYLEELIKNNKLIIDLNDGKLIIVIYNEKLIF